ncbi:hypothetical protein ASE06_15570 [Sphingopyxis sp. Root214]|uniref:SDR family NAD(P)-dependent oxidoreductase n=1 Tax=unclassified Sphingopyxis TaxID=2614943 RepID=UPI0006FCDE2B|nr:MULTISPECIES: SDR family NAD(P)-dependent oxidoreductase [unclassified Sphingopyxis]KQZ73755.1 hypothetical protein ASD73_13225 [Sphingopyxis sp. Root154]KRC07896.1 hypothetical protein ASE06_15570 [Sphingopyxis sp. Root214]
MTQVREIAGRTLLVTGANRGLGAALVEHALELGAGKVYAGVRDVSSLADRYAAHGDRVVPVTLDVTNDEQVARAAETLTDVDILLSNAGVTYMVPLLEATIEGARQTMETNYFGPLRLIKAFGPGLEARQGALISILSLAALVPAQGAELYSASKAAGVMLGHAASLAFPSVAVSLCYPGLMDTEMMQSSELPKTSPQEIARNILSGWVAGEIAIFPDGHARLLREEYVARPTAILDQPYSIMTGALMKFLAAAEA